MTLLVRTRGELREALASSAPTAVVMTMGALHAGHAELMRMARTQLPAGGRVIVTDFVNPTQFGAGEDFERYPRTLEADVQLCENHGVDIVFAPTTDEMYAGSETGVVVDPGPRGRILEGASRPGHFAGVLTVVAKLLHLTRPDIAVFGEKDYQQLVLIRDMVHALDFPTEVVGAPTVRESDGLAMSSRNRYLPPEARTLASSIPRALAAGEAAATTGADAAARAARDLLDAAGIDIDYVEVRSTSLDEAPGQGIGRLLVAVRIGEVRLIDNTAVMLGGAP